MIYIIIQIVSDKKYQFVISFINIIPLGILDIGFITYFSIVVSRMYKKVGNLKTGTIILSVCLVIPFIAYTILSLCYGFSVIGISYLIILAILFTFTYSLLLKKSTKVSCIWFILAVLGFIVTYFLKNFRDNQHFINQYAIFDTANFLKNICKVIMCISPLGVIPYFVNYYKILKEGNK